MKKMLGLLLIAAVGLFIAAGIATTDNGYKVGDKATDFELKNVDGKMVSLSDYEDANGYIVIFTCNTCPYAVANEDRIIELHNKYADKGWPVIAIQPNNPEMKPGDSFEAMKERAASKGFEFPYLIDEGQTIFPQYGADRTPHVFLLDKDRIVRYIGAIDDSPRTEDGVSVKYVEDAISAIEKGEDPKVTFTKAIGCTIKA
jgi:peroxiredoxin